MLCDDFLFSFVYTLGCTEGNEKNIELLSMRVQQWSFTFAEVSFVTYCLFCVKWRRDGEAMKFLTIGRNSPKNNETNTKSKPKRGLFPSFSSPKSNPTSPKGSKPTSMPSKEVYKSSPISIPGSHSCPTGGGVSLSPQGGSPFLADYPYRTYSPQSQIGKLLLEELVRLMVFSLLFVFRQKLPSGMKKSYNIVVPTLANTYGYFAITVFCNHNISGVTSQ